MKTDLDVILDEIEENAKVGTGETSILGNNPKIVASFARAREDIPRVVKALRYVFEDLFPPLYKMTDEEHKRLFSILKGE